MQNAWQKESKIVELHIQNLSLNFQCLSYNIVAGKFVRRKNTLIWIKPLVDPDPIIIRIL